MPLSSSALGALRSHVRLDTATGPWLGLQRVELLEAIERHGSIARTARAVGIAYKAAWESVDDINNMAGQPLVLRSAGGARGGGSRLTEQGCRLVAFYRAFEAEHQRTLEQLRHTMQAHHDCGDVDELRRVLRRLSMQSSARNQFTGTVRAVRSDGIEARVELDLGHGLPMAAVVTADSSRRLGLEPGQEVHALVKSSCVVLVDPAHSCLSACNRYAGRVARVQRGPVRSEVVLQLDGSALQLAATVSDAGLARLDARAGQPLLACFQADSVMLARMV